jgi:2'-5' RNA ligase
VPRLFLAVWPPEDVAAVLRALPRKDARGVRFVAEDNWHVTLRFLGEAHPDDVVAAMAGPPLPAATARVGPGVDVLAERALVVPVGGLDALAAEVATRTRSVGDAPPRRRYTGHLTVARLKRHARMPHAMGLPLQVAFDVDEVALVQSRLDPAGARYQTIHTWPTR